MSGEGWKNFADKLADDKKTVEEPGSGNLIQSALLNALNSTHLLFLTGAGTSICARNEAELKQDAPGMSDLWTAVETKVGQTQFKSICDQFSGANIDKNIEKLLSLCKIQLELLELAKDDDPKKKPILDFVKNAEAAILKRVDFVDDKTTIDAHSLIVRKIGRRGIRKPRTKLYTTNYDLCFEEAARRQRFTIIDGFSHSLDQVYDRSHFDQDIVRRENAKDAPDYIANVFHLYKLHGSLDWRRVDGEILRSRGDNGSPVLIYPRSSKYQEAFEAPYLDMMGAFQAALREPDSALIVCGFGFNDDHISRPILAAMEANMSLRLIVCDPAFIQDEESLAASEHVIPDVPDEKNTFLLRLRKLAESGDPRIHLINGRFSDLAVALPDLIGESDRERHIARTKLLREPVEAVK
ncbi:SIR2 family protein [Methylocystis sp. MitZ-2018]|nr:SIR2 family protein [Methylocystis sp. MitZ-2018]